MILRFNIDQYKQQHLLLNDQEGVITIPQHSIL